MSIFSIKTGERVSITTQQVNLEWPDMQAKGMLKSGVTYWATATDRYQEIGGVKHRLFVDASEDFGLGREIWLTDGPTVYQAAREEEWPDTIAEVVRKAGGVMAVKQELKFKSSDGREFDNEAEAQRHDELNVAREEYEHALSKMNSLIVKTAHTADGYLCELGIFIDYWYVSPGWHGLPDLRKVPYLGWNWHLNYHNDVIVIVHRESGRERTDEYAIKDLYREKKNALAALVEAQKAWLKEREQEVAETAAKVSSGLDPTRG